MMWDKLKKIFTKPRLILCGKVAVFVVGAALSYDMVQDMYILFGSGGIFGVVVIIWHAQTFRDLVHWRCLLFVIASMLIGTAMCLSIVITGLIGKFIIVNELYVSVLIGTILLAVTHYQLLGISRKRLRVAIPCIYAIWVIFFTLNYGPNSTINPFDDVEMNGWDHPLINHVTIWQAAYLVSMFGFRKKEPEDRGDGIFRMNGYEDRARVYAVLGLIIAIIIGLVLLITGVFRGEFN